MNRVAAALALCAGLLSLPAFAQPADLSAYDGLYPHDAVDGVTFIEHPLVVAAVERVVSFPEYKRTILKDTFAIATVIPIREFDGQLLMWAFDPPTAGDTQWGLLISPDGARVSVCFGSYENDEFGTDWYTETGHEYVGDTRCPGAAEDLAAFEDKWVN